MKIRIAKQSDVQSIMDLGCEFLPESQYSHLKLNLEKAFKTISHFVNNDDFLTLVVEDDNGRACGYFIGSVYSMYFTDDKMASDITLFVKKEQRGSVAGKLMVKEYEKWALEKGVPPADIAIGRSSGIDDEKADAFLTRMGYDVKAVLFKKVRWGTACA